MALSRPSPVPGEGPAEDQGVASWDRRRGVPPGLGDPRHGGPPDVEVLDPGQAPSHHSPGGPAQPGRLRRPAPVASTLLVALLVVVLAGLLRAGVVTSVQLVLFGVLIPSIILHEVAHGWVALAFGDDTAKRAGRLTLNPLAHVDPVGTVIVPVVTILYGHGFFGWAKPVPVNYDRLRHPRNQSLVVALAGPATNVALAACFAVLFHLSGAAYAIGSSVPLWVEIVFYAGLINVWLAVFNMIPVPPLDGSALLERLLPRSWLPAYLRVRPYTLMILFGAVLLTSLSPSTNVLGHLEQSTSNWWAHVVGLS